ncbi:MAG: hypothetical protein IH600_03770 [Bacteroidetes bacterium]|nr:hypothetical protein [Bacteroidota bacterium]
MTIRNTLFVLSLLLLATGTLKAQGLEIERTIPGFPENASGMLAMTVGSKDRLDFNGDGMPDRVFTAKGFNGTETFTYTIVDGSDPTRSWVMQLEGDPDHPLIVGSHRLVGFFDLDGTVNNANPKEMVVAKFVPVPLSINYKLENVMISSYSSTSPTVPAQPLGIIAILIGIADMDRDGKDEILLANPTADQTEIWGMP